MEKYVIGEPDWAEEALFLLECMAGGHFSEGYAAACDHLAEKLPDKRAEQELMKAAYGAVAAACPLTEDEKSLFGRCKEEDEDFSAAACVRRMARYAGEPAAKRCARLADTLELYDMPQEPERFLVEVEQRPLSLREKWLCVQVLFNLDAVVSRVQAAIERAGRALAPFCDALAAPCERWRARLEPKLRDGGIDQVLGSAGLQLDDGHPLMIVPGVFAGRVITLYSDELDVPVDQRLTLRLGLMVEEICELNARKESDDADALRFVHALDDASRLAILRALKEGTHNGRELSALTALSPATISHHMNELVICDLVTMEKKGASILYRSNARNVSRGLDILREQLLE